MNILIKLIFHQLIRMLQRIRQKKIKSIFAYCFINNKHKNKPK